MTRPFEPIQVDEVRMKYLVGLSLLISIVLFQNCAPTSQDAAESVEFERADFSSEFDKANIDESPVQSAVSVPGLLEGNLVKNGNFERFAEGSVIANWQTWAPCSQAIKLDGVARFDSKAIQLVDTSANIACGAISDVFSIQDSKSYTLEVSARATGTNNSASVYVLYFRNGVEVLRKSYGVSGAVDQWNHLKVQLQIPSGANQAKVLLYSSKNAVMTVRYDGIAVYESSAIEKTFYVSVGGAGSKNGSSLANAAPYLSSSFWTVVKGELANKSVKVIFSNQVYSIANSSQRLGFKGWGNAQNRLTLEGQNAYGTVFSHPLTGTEDTGYLLAITDSQNISIRNMSFRSSATVDIDYILPIRNSRNITLAGLSAINLKHVKYGVIGAHVGSSNIRIRNSEFLRLGYDAHQHFLYAFREISKLWIENNTFEDSTGSYLRCRDTCREIYVLNNVFFATGSWGSSDEFRYQHFVELCAYPDKQYRVVSDPAEQASLVSQQEYFDSGFSSIGNKFRYMNTRGTRAIPYAVEHAGWDPFDGEEFRRHILTTADKNVMRNGSISARRALISSRFRLSLTEDFNIRNNEYAGGLFIFELETASGYGATSLGGNGRYNISDLIQP